jgi:hypothetical protein
MPSREVARPCRHVYSAAPRSRRRDDVPAEVSELLVNALESHGDVRVCVCVVVVVVYGGVACEGGVGR